MVPALLSGVSVVPVTQTLFGRDGNCYAACLSSILEIPIERGTGTHGGHLDAVNRFLATRNLAIVRVPYRAEAWEKMNRGAWCVLAGRSPRGDFLHAVVGRDGRIVFDPHPSRSGIATLASVDLFVARPRFP